VIPVYQEDDWSCHRACVASLLEMPLEEMPGICPADYDYNTNGWADAWDEWLESLGFVSYDITFRGHSPKGYTIAQVASQKFPGKLHSIVCLNGEPVHDPQRSNEPYTGADVQLHTILAPMNPARMLATW
jgi:hypothetical protein